MTKGLLLLLVILPFFVSPLSAFGAEITGPEAQIVSSEIVVSTGLALDEKHINDLKSGVPKEITFHIDLFRVWKGWLDEFITGQKVVITMHSDRIKNENIAASFDGSTIIKKRFKSFDSMLASALHLKDMRLANLKDLDPADYYIKVTVELRAKQLPPVLGYLLFFVPENEFKILKSSSPFSLGGGK